MEDPTVAAMAALKVMDAVDSATHDARMNMLTELAFGASISLLAKGAMTMNEWEAFKTSLTAAKNSAATAASVLAQAAATASAAPPPQEIASATAAMQDIASNLAAAVASFTVVANPPPPNTPR
jgi:hypothetical protein